MSKIIVTTASRASELVKQAENKTAVISVSTPGKSKAEFANRPGCVSVWQYAFADTECTTSSLKREMAENMATVLDTSLNDGSDIIIHGEGTDGRVVSLGIVLGEAVEGPVSFALGQSSEFIVDFSVHDNYMSYGLRPNLRVLMLMREAMGLETKNESKTNLKIHEWIYHNGFDKKYLTQKDVWKLCWKVRVLKSAVMEYLAEYQSTTYAVPAWEIRTDSGEGGIGSVVGKIKDAAEKQLKRKESGSGEKEPDEVSE